MSQEEVKGEAPALINAVRDSLSGLITDPYPYVPNPESCKRRASVALVLRIRPHYEHWPSTCLAQADSTSREAFVQQFFEQSWVQHGDPEVVFIKRAARVGDRWTSHVALPGGKRDPEDEDDKAVAIRETSEEIGLDLTSEDAFFVGNLPERVVSTSWGKVPIMVLCPFVFLWTQPDLPPFHLQPTEVASTHWVPLRILLSPSSRTCEYVDVSDRFARRGGAAVKAIIRSILGKMQFSAIRLLPSESLFCSSTAEYFNPPEENEEVESKSITSKLYSWYLGDHAGSAEKTRPLLLWGLTLGILADFLDQLPPYNAVQLWAYPTFTSVDVRWIINALTFSLKRRNRSRLQGNQTAVDDSTEAVATGDNPWFIGGLSDGMKPLRREPNAKKSYAVGVMLEGYYDMARRGVWMAASLRFIAAFVLGYHIMKRCRQRVGRYA
ncbi:putative NUDIX family hydrolase [Mollisia scopiformis]|uniref:Putative NUDIX family hydrolase n=1 Tax=Mollisia scopiformis TaxID=149040 RepID=A0A132B853_MOLSC|nr:putative NUDIX family hydrolase [Mollisia scopiformis]KUJ08586.1 putative NUDIX family hydrolase [Mollisia scopiformis]